MGMVLLALGLVLVVEGLLWALAPRMIEDLLALLRALPIEQRRLIGLLAIAAGLACLAAARALGVM